MSETRLTTARQKSLQTDLHVIKFDVSCEDTVELV